MLHLDTGREWRGGQTQLLHLVRSLPGEVVLPADAPLRPALEAAGVRVHGIRARTSLGWAVALRHLVADRQPDLLAAHTSRAHGHALLAATGRPVVVHRRLDFPPRWCSRPKYRAVDRFVAVSQRVAEVLRQAGVAPTRIEVVHDGVAQAARVWGRAEARRLLGLPVRPRLVGAAGALVPHKDHQSLIRAMVGVDAELVIAGEGPLRDALRALAQRVGVRLILLGQVEEIGALFGAIDVFAHPSREEGLGQVVVEAMLAGVPVVSSSAGGLADVLAAGGRGVPPRDPLSLRDALRDALRDPGPVASARAAAAELFTVEAMVRGTDAAYRRALEGR